MMLTTKGRYAVMAMVDIAMSNKLVEDTKKPVTLADISSRQGITTAYLEQIFSNLKGAGLVKSVRGPGGGYLLNDPSDEITIADIIIAMDESIKMTRCNHDPEKGCISDKVKCLTHDLWQGLSNHIYHYLNSVTIADVCNKNIKVLPDFMSEENLDLIEEYIN